MAVVEDVLIHCDNCHRENAPAIKIAWLRCAPKSCLRCLAANLNTFVSWRGPPPDVDDDYRRDAPNYGSDP